MTVFVKHCLSCIVVGIGVGGGSVMIHAGIAIVGKTVGLSAAETAHSHYASQLQAAVSADFVAEGIEVDSVASIIFQDAVIRVELGAEFRRGKHECHVKSERHAMTAQHRIHVAPIGMAVVGSELAESDIPP